MNVNVENPFDITKAVDFNDQQINTYWVDMPRECRFIDMMKPTSSMPMLILGGKGSGKTHLIRYFSYQLQKLRNNNDIRSITKHDGYIGIYLRCGGLNASRFCGKGLSENEWGAVYAYYMDVWVAQLILGIICDAYKDKEDLQIVEKEICLNSLLPAAY